ncbi:uncharacterized protein PHACADRAFT_170100 [Phanerochaete carnosa HHB-10118-sp]|uniref:Mediator of RNA polymerase II transcription subunit 20 n=1 Tax=Phanerochaete carnosa (strain HHB-10118-sp) TaxID=650164 RepID=K5V9K7_PHACS|nr:uncharacterized protein PHACADRAFT_170100 [Phanerochaete carnosa HHB-10118-sp]EKM59521.1 hypothetical protein PHACADRAFT_170100 [Phanerochaete carnosa HHB-10118-sp]
MGVTGLARYVNAPTTGVDLISMNITRNHQGVVRGKWNISVKSFRSALGSIPGFQVHSERTMCALTMNDNVFVLLEDPAAPQRSDLLQPPEGQAPIPLTGPGAPTHYRTTFLTLSPPGALEQLLSQLRARWASVRQSGPAGPSQASHLSGQQLSVEGLVYSIGTDFIVRAGNVILAGGAVKGMLIEAEYLPLPTMHAGADGTLELLNNLLVSCLPEIPGANLTAVTISDAIWQELLWDREREEEQQQQAADGKPPEQEESDDIFVSGDEGLPAFRKGDWIGTDRDQRSAYLIMGALKSEGLL